MNLTALEQAARIRAICEFVYDDRRHESRRSIW